MQNASDSIRNAECAGTLTPGQGLVRLSLDPSSRTITVRDNGEGVLSGKVGDSLIDIGMSTKQIERDAGFRGIGRLAGIAYSDALLFRTSASGEDVETSVRIDCRTIREAISPAQKRFLELSEVVAKNCRVYRQRCNPQDHFFEVTLEGVSDAATCYLDWHQLEVYLSQVAPVDFDAQRFPFASRDCKLDAVECDLCADD